MIDEQLRKQAAAIFARMGLSEEEAVALFYKRTVEAGKMPFGPASEGPALARIVYKIYVVLNILK